MGSSLKWTQHWTCLRHTKPTILPIWKWHLMHHLLKCWRQHNTRHLQRNKTYRHFFQISFNLCSGPTCLLLSRLSLYCSTRKTASKYHFAVTLKCHFNPLSHCWHILSSGFVSSFPVVLLFLFLLPLSLQYSSTEPRMLLNRSNYSPVPL